MPQDVTTEGKYIPWQVSFKAPLGAQPDGTRAVSATA